MPISKKNIIVICFFVGFIFYLFFANSIILKLMGKSSPVVLKNVEALEINSDESYVNLTYFNSVGNLTQDIFGYGWIFIPHQEDITSKKVSLVFKGDNKSYLLSSMRLTNKVGLPDRYPDLLKNEEKTQFEFNISGLNMENGIYEIMIYNEENAENKVLAYSGTKLIKDSLGIKEYIPGEINDIELSEIVFDNQLYSSLHVYDEKNRFCLYGWTGIKGKCLQFKKVYLKITDENGNIKYYDTSNTNRPETAEYLKDNNFFHSGFKSYVNKDSFVPNTTYTIDVILNIDDKWFYNSLGDYYCESSSVVKKIKK